MEKEQRHSRKKTEHGIGQYGLKEQISANSFYGKTKAEVDKKYKEFIKQVAGGTYTEVKTIC